MEKNFDKGAHMRAMVVLTPAESKRLIAKAVSRKLEVRAALTSGYLILCEGSTNVFIAEELFNIHILCEAFLSGVSCQGVLCNAAREIQSTFPLIFHKGELVDMTIREALDDFHQETVFIKGGNAIDPTGLVGMIVSGYTGGSIATAIGTCVSQGLRIISPIGLEKSVGSVIEASRHCGGKTYDYSMGADFGLMVVPQADVVTEIEAITLLSGAYAIHVASGGIDGSEGAVVLMIEGDRSEVAVAIDIIESIKGEPPQKAIKMNCSVCRYVNCHYHGNGLVPTYIGG